MFCFFFSKKKFLERASLPLSSLEASSWSLGLSKAWAAVVFWTDGLMSQAPKGSKLDALPLLLLWCFLPEPRALFPVQLSQGPPCPEGKCQSSRALCSALWPAAMVPETGQELLEV